MAWTVGYETIYIGDTFIEGQWEVDADSEESAKNPDLMPYLLVGRREWADVPYPEIEWVASNELHGQESIATTELDDDGEVITVLLTLDQTAELAHIMDRATEGVSMADFLDNHV